VETQLESGTFERTQSSQQGVIGNAENADHAASICEGAGTGVGPSPLACVCKRSSTALLDIGRGASSGQIAAAKGNGACSPLMISCAIRARGSGNG
jgi:hypothetical protein